MLQRTAWLFALCFMFGGRDTAAGMEGVRVSADRRSFILGESNARFMPWGFNYDHDESGRLLEDYWEREWPKVEEDFREMKHLGANVVRVHLQLCRLMASAEKPNEASLDRLGRLVALAEKMGFYLDITGLACYRRKDVPKWYDDLSEKDRWDVQARFWEAVAERLRQEPGHLLLRPDERAGRARRQQETRRLARAAFSGK